MCNTSGIPRAPPPSPTAAAIAGRLQKLSVDQCAAAPRQSAAHQVSSGSESTPSAPPPRTLSISPLQRDDETAELEARVLRLARACAARGRRAPARAAAGAAASGPAAPEPCRPPPRPGGCGWSRCSAPRPRLHHRLRPATAPRHQPPRRYRRRSPCSDSTG